LIYNQRSSLLSSAQTNAHRQGARRRLAIVLIEVFKLLTLSTVNGGRFDIQRQNRLLIFPSYARQLITVRKNSSNSLEKQKNRSSLNLI
jgi:hypothetical protein